MRRISRRSVQLGLAVALLALAAGLPRTAAAQWVEHAPKRADGEPDLSPRARRQTRFNLFGLADAAVAAIKTSDTKYYWGTTNNNAQIASNTSSWAYSYGGPSDPAYFSEVAWVWGTPPSVLDTIKKYASPTGAAGLSSVLGLGFNAQSFDNLNGTDVILARDGDLGTYFSGAQSTTDHSCLDNQQGFYGSGNPLLATSDCPQTWGPLGWQGRRPVPQSDYLSALAANPLGFSFDFWKYPSGEPPAAGTDGYGKLDRQFGSFQTYGWMSDYSKDEVCGTAQTRSYGKVMKGFSRYGGCPDAAPTKPGYPLGLEVHFDAFSYGIPALQDVVFYQATVTNNSRQVYDAPIDYDSLYIGFNISSYSENQLNQVYYRPDLGAIIQTPTCAHLAPICNGAVQVADLKPSGVTPASVGGNDFGPWELGSAAIVILKSPIGDLRNKLFSRAGSPFAPFANKVSPALLADTITFNHAHLCGYRACYKTTYLTDYNVNPDATERAFGMMSSTELNVLGSRTPATMGGSPAGQILWHTFRSADWPAAPAVALGDPSKFPAKGGFNHWVPVTGSGAPWDYNQDGQPDTLHLDTCSDKSPYYDASDAASALHTACSGIFSDTMPHSGPDASTRWLAGYDNVGGTVTVGPISLKADSTIGFVLAGTSACCGAGLGDSLALMTKVNAAVDHYMNFYLGPEPLPKDTIVAVDVAGGNQNVAHVTLRFTQTAETSTDQFLLATAGKYAVAQPGTPEYRLAELNPFLVDSLLAYGAEFGKDTAGVTAVGNFQTLYVFKSCDGGNTFTNNASCTPSPATGGPFAALGWLPYATIKRDNNGDIANTFTDLSVNGGTTYTYVIIGESRGANFELQTGDSVATTSYGAICTKNCAVKTIAFAPSLFNSLATSGPNVANVYVPASLQAGAQGPLVSVQTTQGPVPAERVVVTTAANYPAAGTYTVSFYDSVRVTEVDTLSGDLKTRLGTGTKVIGYRDGNPVSLGSINALGGIGMNGLSLLTAKDSSLGLGKPVIRTSLFGSSSLTAVMTGPKGPVLATTDFTEGATPESFYGSKAFPGFLLGFTKASDLEYNPTFGEEFFDNAGKRIAPLVVPFVQTRINSVKTTSDFQGGLYTFTWSGKPFGPAEPFRLDFANPGKTDSIFQASLKARAVADTGITSAEAAAAIGVDQTDLVPVKLPFRITNESFDNGRKVYVAMVKRSKSTMLLGTGGDTISVHVPDDEWIPGDHLYLLEDTGSGKVVTFSQYILGCDPQPGTGVRVSCNPVAMLTPGSTTWITTDPGTKEQILFNPALSTQQQFTITVAAQPTGSQLAQACTSGQTAVCTAEKASIKDVHAVPNPYVAFTPYVNPRDPNNPIRPMLFTHVPTRGMIRIYTVSGQLVQQLTWTEQDLNDTGDLLWNLRTREGNLVAGGLYLFMVTGKDAKGHDLGSHLGKFVIIR